jgi:hypothetical protein
VGEGITVSLRREHLFTPRAFTSLKVNQAIVKLFDGVRVLEPWVVYLKPMHENPEVSWFDTTGRVADEPLVDRPRSPVAALRGLARRLSVARRLRCSVAGALARGRETSRSRRASKSTEPAVDERERTPQNGHHASQP